MRYFIIAGEASGDLHGSYLIKSLLNEDGAAEIFFWGGDLMKDQGGELLQHYKDTSFMGFVEVAKNIRTIWSLFRKCKKQITELEPDLIIFIDYPGFNLRMAKWAKGKAIQTVYYISPQLWAWKASRIEIMKNCIDRSYVILPFEKAYYQDQGLQVDYYGHPLIDIKKDYTSNPAILKKYGKGKVIALLPGSRKQEIRNHLPTMSSICSTFPDYKFVIAARSSIDLSFYEEHSGKQENLSIEFNATYDLLSISSYAIVASGTATLECAIFNVPQVVVYKGNQISFNIAKRIVKVDYISLVNLIAKKEIVKELIQSEFNKDQLIKELKKLECRTSLDKLYEEVIRQLGNGETSTQVAKSIKSTFYT
jgi:lipid-A-disaccharide synthase